MLFLTVVTIFNCLCHDFTGSLLVYDKISSSNPFDLCITRVSLLLNLNNMLEKSLKLDLSIFCRQKP